MGRTAAQVLRPLGSNPSILAEVEYDSTSLMDLHRAFEEILHSGLQIVNFYEKRPTQIFKLWFIQWREFVSLPFSTCSMQYSNDKTSAFVSNQRLLEEVNMEISVSPLIILG